MRQIYSAHVHGIEVNGVRSREGIWIGFFGELFRPVKRTGCFYVKLSIKRRKIANSCYERLIFLKFYFNYIIFCLIVPSAFLDQIEGFSRLFS